MSINETHLRIEMKIKAKKKIVTNAFFRIYLFIIISIH